MPSAYPLKLNYIPQPRIWAGQTLSSHWGKQNGSASVGESWELSVRPDATSRIQNGRLAGQTLAQAIAEDGDILGRTLSPWEFPLLVKLIDAGDTLSVQVHPDDDYAARVENDRGKTEMWYIVDAVEGAELILGLAPGVTKEELVRAIRAGSFAHLLHRQPVRKGECYFIPAGLLHAIGAGILIAEIQQNCDLTYRVYDFERRDAAGNLRELHVDRAIDVIRPFTKEEIHARCFSRAEGAPAKGTLADCDAFSVCEHRCCGALELRDSTLPGHLLCIEGAGVLLSDGQAFRIEKGDSYLLPPSLKGLTLHGELHLLETRFPV